MKINRLFAIVALAVCAVTASAQYNMPTQTFTYDKPYAVEKIKAPKGKKVKNVILDSQPRKTVARERYSHRIVEDLGN